MSDSIVRRFRALIASGDLVPDAAQAKAVEQLQKLATELRHRGRSRFLFRKPPAPKGLYISGDVGRGKSMLMDLFFDAAAVRRKRRVHFNAFMVEAHARIHRERQRGADDPIPAVAQTIAREAALLCFDEFQVADVADAMILGRLFEHMFEAGVVIVATSNTRPLQLYEGGLNRQLFLPFIAMLEARLTIVELNGPADYRLQRLAQLDTYIRPLGPEADAKMNAAWLRLTDRVHGAPQTLTVLGRSLRVPQAARGVARFAFDDLCRKPLAAADYLEVAQHFHTMLIDHVPVMMPNERNEARRFTLLIDTLYDENVKLVCSAAQSPEDLYSAGEGAEAFRRTASRLVEMQSPEYLRRGHSIHAPEVERALAQA